MKLICRAIYIAIFLAPLGYAASAADTRAIEVVTPSQNHSMASDRDSVFTMALFVGQEYNLDVVLIEKSSGLIRLENTGLTVGQLDAYCRYPFVFVETGAPIDTFQGWNQRSLEGSAGIVKGTVSFSLLVSGETSESSINLRSNFNAHNSNENMPCSSTGRLEAAFIEEIKSAL